MKQEIENFIKSKRLAVVGVSRNNSKFGNALYRELKEKGYNVVPVHPSMDSFEGDTCSKRIQDINPKVDAVIINVNKEHAKAIIEDAHQAGVKNLWLQQGSETPETIEYAKSLDLNIVTGKCIMMYAEPVKSVHAFHRFLWKLLKQY
jgi:predicted CoA-binding protein